MKDVRGQRDKSKENEKGEGRGVEKGEMRTDSAAMHFYSSPTAALKVIGFDCEWRPEHYFNYKLKKINDTSTVSESPIIPTPSPTLFLSNPDSNITSISTSPPIKEITNQKQLK